MVLETLESSIERASGSLQKVRGSKNSVNLRHFITGYLFVRSLAIQWVSYLFLKSFHIISRPNGLGVKTKRDSRDKKGKK